MFVPNSPTFSQPTQDTHIRPYMTAFLYTPSRHSHVQHLPHNPPDTEGRSLPLHHHSPQLSAVPWESLPWELPQTPPSPHMILINKGKLYIKTTLYHTRFLIYQTHCTTGNVSPMKGSRYGGGNVRNQQTHKFPALSVSASCRRPLVDVLLQTHGPLAGVSPCSLPLSPSLLTQPPRTYRLCDSKRRWKRKNGRR